MSDPHARKEVDLREDLKQLQIVSEDAERVPPRDSRPSGRRAAGRRGRSRKTLWIGLGAAFFVVSGTLQYLAPKPVEVSIVPITVRDLGVPPVVLSAVGYVVPRREIIVSSKTQGKIVEMPVEENQRVKAGDLLARLESQQVQANLQLAEAQLADAERELDLTSKLFEKGVRPQSFLDRARTNYEIALAQASVARVSLEDTVLRAPFEGTIVRKLRDLGEFLTIGVTAEGAPGTAVVELADLDQIEVELEVNETEISKIRPRMAALVIPEALPQRRYQGEVVEVASRADRRKAIVPVRVRIDEPDADLLPDMTAKVRFLEQAPVAPIRVQRAVPSSAVVRRDGRDVVFVVENDVATAVAVEIDPVPDYVEQPGAYLTVAGNPGGYSAVASGGDTRAGDGSGGGTDRYAALRSGPAEGVYVIENPPADLESGSAVRVAQ